VTSDGWNFWLGLAALLSGVLSIAAIYIAVRARADAADQLRRERRLDFEIAVLLELVDRVHDIEETDSLRGRLDLLPDVLPYTRWAARQGADWPASLGPEPGGVFDDVKELRRSNWGWRRDDGGVERVAGRMQDELLTAIRSKVDERGAPKR
jgi:hypothetical protein